MLFRSLVEWDTDCNADGQIDFGQIQRGELEDIGQNGIPDICETKSYRVGTGPGFLIVANGYLFVANTDDGTISKLNVKTGAVSLTFPAGGHPTGMAFDGTYLWTANAREGTVSKLTQTGVLKGTYPVGPSPMRIAYDGS